MAEEVPQPGRRRPHRPPPGPAAEAADLHERQRRRGSAGAALLQARRGRADRLPRRARPRAVQGQGEASAAASPATTACARSTPRSAPISAACASASAIPGRQKDQVTPHVLGNYAKAEMEPLSDLLGAIAAEAEWLADGDDARFMSEVALRLQQDDMTVRSLFATQLYEAEIGDAALLGELAHSIRSLAEDDAAGSGWSRDKGYRGLYQLRLAERPAAARPGLRRSGEAARPPRRRLRRGLRLRPARKPKLDSLWVNLLKAGGHHSAHIHPHCIISGTLLRRGADGLRRHPLRGSSPADDDGRAAAPDDARDASPSSPSSRAPACCCCGKAGFATKCSPAPARASG